MPRELSADFFKLEWNVCPQLLCLECALLTLQQEQVIGYQLCCFFKVHRQRLIKTGTDRSRARDADDSASYLVCRDQSPSQAAICLPNIYTSTEYHNDHLCDLHSNSSR